MLTDSFYPEIGGSETAIWNLCDTFARAGHVVGVAVITQRGARSPSDLFSFWNVSSRMAGVDAKYLGKIRNFRRVIRSFLPDVLNVHFMLESGYVGVRSAQAEGIPCVLTNRGKGLYNEPSNSTERLLYWWWNRGALGADAYIATSQEMVDRMLERYGIASRAISNGVDTENFRPDRDGGFLRERYGVREGQRVILCARRLVPKNGIEYILRALPLVRQYHDAVLWLASPLIREYEKLRALVRELGLADVVRFLGPVDHTELPFHFRAADVVVQPSIAEARSLACLEAMASGAAIVATATGGLPELLTHGESGYLIDPFQESTYAVTTVHDSGVRRLAAAVTTVLSDDSLRVRLGTGARTYAETCSWSAIAEQTLAVYEEVIHRYRPS